jgi:hypothetical protein
VHRERWNARNIDDAICVVVHGSIAIFVSVENDKAESFALTCHDVEHDSGADSMERSKEFQKGIVVDLPWEAGNEQVLEGRLVVLARLPAVLWLRILTLGGHSLKERTQNAISIE